MLTLYLPVCSLSEEYGAELEKEVVCLIDSKVKMIVIKRIHVCSDCLTH